MNGKEEQLRVYLEANCSGRENIQNSGQLERALERFGPAASAGGDSP